MPVSVLWAVTLLDLGLLVTITVHALIVKNFNWITAALYLLTGDTMAGLQPFDSASIQQQLGVIGMTVGPGNTSTTFSSYSPFSAHFFMFVLCTNAILLFLHLTRLAIWFFFGDLRLIERQHLKEWGWITGSETMLAMTIFRGEISAEFCIYFAALMSLKCLHWILRDRIDFMEQMTAAPRQDFIPKNILLISLLLLADLNILVWAVQCLQLEGPSMLLLFANEFSLLLVSLLLSATRFGMNVYEIQSGKK